MDRLAGLGAKVDGTRSSGTAACADQRPSLWSMAGRRPSGRDGDDDNPVSAVEFERAACISTITGRG